MIPICECGHAKGEHKELEDGSIQCFFGFPEMGFLCNCYEFKHRGYKEELAEVQGKAIRPIKG